MALEDWTDDGEEDDVEPEQNTTTPDEADSTKRAIAAKIQSRCMKDSLDVYVDSGRVEGDIEDLAMMFALMTMDYRESDFQELVTDDVE
jgi:hypothetical protein